ELVAITLKVEREVDRRSVKVGADHPAAGDIAGRLRCNHQRKNEQQSCKSFHSAETAVITLPQSPAAVTSNFGGAPETHSSSIQVRRCGTRLRTHRFLHRLQR